MISLFIDTSSSDVCVSVLRDGVVLAEICKNIPGEHSIYTTSFLDEVIKKAGIERDSVDKIMVVNGPGSFTGLRIGVTIAKVYAYLLGINVICVSSLKMRALSFSHDYCLSLLDARHNNYYLGLYDKDNNEVIKEQFASIDFVLELINKYNPSIVSDVAIDDDLFKASFVQIDVSAIYDYYKDSEGVNCHLAVPNYLKLPQAMEDAR